MRAPSLQPLPVSGKIIPAGARNQSELGHCNSVPLPSLRVAVNRAFLPSPHLSFNNSQRRRTRHVPICRVEHSLSATIWQPQHLCSGAKAHHVFLLGSNRANQTLRMTSPLATETHGSVLVSSEICKPCYFPSPFHIFMHSPFYPCQRPIKNAVYFPHFLLPPFLL